jgi:hypothetical protein
MWRLGGEIVRSHPLIFFHHRLGDWRCYVQKIFFASHVLRSSIPLPDEEVQPDKIQYQRDCEEHQLDMRLPVAVYDDDHPLLRREVGDEENSVEEYEHAYIQTDSYQDG